MNKISKVLFLCFAISGCLCSCAGGENKITDGNQFYDLTVGKTLIGYVVVVHKVTSKDYESVKKL